MEPGREMNGKNTFVHYFLNLTSVSRLRMDGSSTLFPRCAFVPYSGSGKLQGICISETLPMLVTFPPRTVATFLEEQDGVMQSLSPRFGTTTVS
jgi:hypothetical protein